MGTGCSSCFKGDETVIAQPDMVNLTDSLLKDIKAIELFLCYLVSIVVYVFICRQ